MKISKLAASALIMLALFCSNLGAQGKESSTDFATADGSLRAGLHNGSIYCVLTGLNTVVILSPDSWSSDAESVSWNQWLVDFDNSLFTNWVNSEPGDGQETVHVRISANRAITQEPGKFFSGASLAQPQVFADAITKALEKTLKDAAPMPQTKNPLSEIRYDLTFMRDSKMAPRFGREQLGFMSVLDPKGDTITVYGRMKEGRAPGIQIIGDKEGGNIRVTDNEPFLQKCREMDATSGGVDK